MNQYKIGSYIKTYRLHKNLSQLEISQAMGWKESSQLSRIEQGKVERPTKQIITRLSKAMQLTPAERGMLFKAAGYRPGNKLILDTIGKLQDKLEVWQFPARLYDYSWRILYENKLTRKLYYSNNHEATQVMKTRPNILTVKYDTKSYLHKLHTLKEKDSQYLTNCTKRILSTTEDYKDTKWRKDLISKLMDYKDFAKVYKEIRSQEEIPNVGLDDIVKEVMAPYLEQDTTLSFYTLSQVYKQDPRFTAEFYIPADKCTFEYFYRLD